MLFQIGRGGDGKGMEAILDAALFGTLASATLDCGVFLDRQEFRKSAELAWNKSNIRIQEMHSLVRFISDIWKRFVVDEEIDCRVNYGFTSKRCFGHSMKVQELNYENVPRAERERRFVSSFGGGWYAFAWASLATPWTHPRWIPRRASTS